MDGHQGIKVFSRYTMLPIKCHTINDAITKVLKIIQRMATKQDATRNDGIGQQFRTRPFLG